MGRIARPKRWPHVQLQWRLSKGFSKYIDYAHFYFQHRLPFQKIPSPKTQTACEIPCGTFHYIRSNSLRGGEAWLHTFSHSTQGS